MSDADGQERTEDATARKREQAREKGQVPRSRELASVAVLVSGAVGLMWFGEGLGTALGKVMSRMFTLSREEVFDVHLLLTVISNAVWQVFLPLVIILVFLFTAALIGAVGLGGVRFSSEAAMPKLSKMNPMSGLKRMFGSQSWVELIKSVLKVGLVASVAGYLIYSSLDDFFQLSIEIFPANYFHALDILLNFILLICCSLLVVVAIDVPYQIWHFSDQLKMTKQEIKDEYKDSEGKPEVKGRIRMLQREMAQRRMMADVPQADVVITNPEHFSVALRYDPKSDAAPVVIAKGGDHLALKIREIANKHNIDIVPAAPLARAIYYTTELDQQVPDGLFVAVAQVLAYVFQLKAYRRGKGQKPILSAAATDIPEELRH
ncbi:flagellar biosynthesis protein FlhB [Photobacterium carnosum]|uniref:Flagellar biosynthetic protein FlhB n=1 Tax=Photobacterium carnosum TaxID=2023717 RepID=A0A2N4UXS6_9GAMM|nr:flagellar biosynthesis protein FlhB [Photobacterium carnosum]MBY3787253.1 flagellar biosynthesis protein FlhB [Photobacterium carnosum]MCD9493653.1 flagellar biosynthesis protein FlhB [Photobacterium carnosum]MCD9523153.1 flagellar biosynthesis protein FlhB [Photobacterium carnosum]MCD9532540.1 flagellar biosynthesis protein FlhB [Photobacterium carnosum]PLC59822.1 flagellar biosynthesis protein FlhB [Photobacterium carnosum]